MRVAITIEDGRQQIILTPEGDHEKSCLDQLHAKGIALKVYKGGFYQCQGGWTRRDGQPDSTILVMEKVKDETETDQIYSA